LQQPPKSIEKTLAWSGTHRWKRGHFGRRTYFSLGAADSTKSAAAKAVGKKLPDQHTSRFEPLPEPTLRTGVTAMTAVALSLLQ
jgi:hypothetical protein